MLRITTSHEAGRLGGCHEVLALGHREAHHTEPQADRHPERKVTSEWIGQRHEGKAQQEAHQQSEQQTHNAGHELGRGHGLDLADEPSDRNDGEIGQQQETDQDPGDDPEQDDQGRRGAVLERGFLRQNESQAHQRTDGSAEQADDSDHVCLALRTAERAG